LHPFLSYVGKQVYKIYVINFFQIIIISFILIVFGESECVGSEFPLFFVFRGEAFIGFPLESLKMRFLVLGAV